MAMSRTKKRGWFVTVAVILGAILIGAKNPEKVKEYAAKVPFLSNLLNK